MFYNYSGDVMTRRRLKVKNVLILIFILVIIISSIFLIFKPKKAVHQELPVIEEEPVQEKKLSLIAVGDVLIHESVYKDAYKENGYDFSHMFTEIEPLLKNYDLKFCNQESTIGGNYLGISGYPNFNAPDEIGDEIVRLGFNLISLANNHAMDRGEDAVNYSNSYWSNKNVVTAGSHQNEDELQNIKIYEKNGIRYAFLAYTTSLNGYLTKNYLVNMYSDEKAKNDIDKIRDNVDLIIVSMHWGEEYINNPNVEQKRIANYLSSLGVNLIIGHHPHVVQPISYINDTLVIYSLGNFISNQLVLGINQGIGLMVGMDIKLENDKIIFENVYKELILSYSENSTNFKVIPFSKLNNDLLNNYENIEIEYLNIVNGG